MKSFLSTSLLFSRTKLVRSYKYIDFEPIYGLQASKAHGQAVLQIRVSMVLGMFDFKVLKINVHLLLCPVVDNFL